MQGPIDQRSINYDTIYPNIRHVFLLINTMHAIHCAIDKLLMYHCDKKKLFVKNYL